MIFLTLLKRQSASCSNLRESVEYMEKQWIVAEALQALKNGLIEHRIFIASHYPILATASMEDIVKAALEIVKAEDLEEKLRTNAVVSMPQDKSENEALIAAELSPEELERAKQSLLPRKKKMKTQPVIDITTGKVYRAQGRPPKEVQPIYVRSEEEAQILLLQQQNRKEG